jgi:hypothetical protein
MCPAIAVPRIVMLARALLPWRIANAQDEECLVDYFGRTVVAGMPKEVRVGVIKVSVPGCLEHDTVKRCLKFSV